MKESGEMYLETILVLGKENNMVRAIDVVEKMGFSKPSVSRALAILKEDNCIIVDENGHIAMTEKGRLIAEKIYERHNVLTQVLVKMGVGFEQASEDACKMEHDISNDTFEAFKKYLQENEK